MYEAKGFTVSTVTSDGEPSIVTLKQVLLPINIALNVLGRGSRAHHAESAIRHIKNKARSTAHSLAYTLPGKWAPLRVRWTAGCALSSVPCSWCDELLIRRDAHEIRGRGHYGWCYSLEVLVSLRQYSFHWDSWRFTVWCDGRDGKPLGFVHLNWMWLRSAALNSTKTQKRHSKTLFL